MTRHQKAKQDRLEIWQWNCRSIRRKKGMLSQLLASQAEPPAVIALQEVGSSPSISGYEVFAADDESWKVATMVEKTITTIRHDQFKGIETPHILVEVVQKSDKKQGTFILNVYSPPPNERSTSTGFSEKH